jgi:hypothetical protein
MSKNDEERALSYFSNTYRNRLEGKKDKKNRAAFSKEERGSRVIDDDEEQKE